MSTNHDAEWLNEHTKKMNELFKDGKTLFDLANEKPKANIEYEELPCYACQGGGCPVCNGYGTITQVKNVEVTTSSPLMDEKCGKEQYDT